jgi:hypothetical protein
MRWERWSNWLPGDPRWKVRVIDTSVLSVEQVADELAEWIAEERTAFGRRSDQAIRAALSAGAPTSSSARRAS